MDAAVTGAVHAADWTSEAPGDGRTVPDAGNWSGVDEIATPVDADRRRTYRPREMQGTGIIRHDHGALGKQPCEPAKREPSAEVLSLAAHLPHHGLDQLPLWFSAGDDHPSAGGSEGVSQGCELLRGPLPASVVGARMQGDEWRVVRHDASRLGQVLLRYRQVRLYAHGHGPNERDDLQKAKDLGLVVDVGRPQVQRSSVRRPQASSGPGLEAQGERVGVSPATVYLDSEVKALLLHLLEEAIQLLRVPRHPRLYADPFLRRDYNHSVYGSRPPGQERLVPGIGEQDDLGVRIRRAQGVQRWQAEDEVAEVVGPKDGDLTHVSKQAGARRM